MGDQSLDANRKSQQFPGSRCQLSSVDIDRERGRQCSYERREYGDGIRRGGKLTPANDTASDPTAISVRSVPSLPAVAGTMPLLTGGTLPVGSTALAIYFNKTVVGAATAANYELRRLGADGLLGTADDVVVPLSVNYSGITATLSFGSLTASVYRLTVRDAITDYERSEARWGW